MDEKRKTRRVLIPSRLHNAKRAPPKAVLVALVEAAGIEPASESHLIQLSPSAADLLRFPSRIADRQAMRYGSHYAVTGRVAPLRSRSPLIDASLPTAVLRGKTGSLIRPPTQLYCCRLLFKIADFTAGRHRYSLTVPHNPRRNLYAPVWCESFPYYTDFTSLCQAARQSPPKKTLVIFVENWYTINIF